MGVKTLAQILGSRSVGYSDVNIPGPSKREALRLLMFERVRNFNKKGDRFSGSCQGNHPQATTPRSTAGGSEEIPKKQHHPKDILASGFSLFLRVHKGSVLAGTRGRPPDPFGPPSIRRIVPHFVRPCHVQGQVEKVERFTVNEGRTWCAEEESRSP